MNNMTTNESKMICEEKFDVLKLCYIIDNIDTFFPSKSEEKKEIHIQ
jgi:hypothetical protein